MSAVILPGSSARFIAWDIPAAAIVARELLEDPPPSYPRIGIPRPDIRCVRLIGSNYRGMKNVIESTRRGRVRLKLIVISIT